MLIQTHGSNTGYQAAPLFEFPGVQSKFHESFAVGLHPVCYRGCPDLFSVQRLKAFARSFSTLDSMLHISELFN